MNEAGDRQAAAGAEPAGTAPGVRLAEARQAQGLTPAEVARQLKLSVWQVEALEAGRYQQLPGPIFVRGFIRNYARLVKLDPDELLHAAGGSLPQSAPRPEMPPSPDIPFPAASRPHWKIHGAVAAALVGMLAFYEFYWNEPPAARPGAVALPAEAPRPGAAKPARPAAGSPQSVASTGSDAKPAEPVITMAAAARTAQDTVPAGAAEPRPVQDPPRAGEKPLVLIFDQESWVEIRDRNARVIFSQLNPPGTQQLVHGLPPFSVVVGNSHGVRMTYDDKPVDLALHTKIDVARLILQ